MTILTLDQSLAGSRPVVDISKLASPTLVAGRPHSYWYIGGVPAAGSMDNSTSGGVALDGGSSLVNGQIYRANPGGSLEARLKNFIAQCSQPGIVQICDRLWHGSALVSGSVISVTSTSAQNLTGVPTLPARDANGATAGLGVRLAMEVYSATGTGTNVPTFQYTDSDGNTGNSASLIDTYVASSALGAFYRVGLATGDKGVRAPTQITNSVSMTSGNVGLVMYRVLGMCPVGATLTPNQIDELTGGFPRVYDGTVPFLVFIPQTTTASVINAMYQETFG